MSDLIDRARREGTPLVSGDTATFVWLGASAPQLMGNWTNWQNGSPQRLEPLAPGAWAVTLSFPRDAYLEYAYWQDGTRLADPLNPRCVPDGLGHDNHFFAMPEFAPTPLARQRRGVARGTLSRHVLHDEGLLVGGKRAVHLYQPPVQGPVPLLVVYDGQDYRGRAALPTIVDNLVALGRLRPLALALVHNGAEGRFIEYACSEAHLGFVVTRVLPLASQELDLLDVQAQPGAYGIMGASMGGLMALYSAWRAPHIFGHVLSQSGAWTLSEHETVAWHLALYGPVPPIRVWLDVGRYEWLLDCNRHMQRRLALRGYDLAYLEHNGGHNYTSWRNVLGPALEWLFPA